ncbi:hypothetical protein [Mycolicibacterium sp. CBMA 226]|uniref:hypothetical protein n=1 Tax=Mycolicibacterium sp. CBMA 226 TaxID=2606611 RepID=UPI0012DF4B54|nr:hypothetical protein [Mycolicibacterium sp. CBMA 226]MUL75701.1 hypothetical protein [Mycolicibacterium sp. CBMA 226]
MRLVIDSHDIAQAARLRAELWRQVEEISQELEQTERRERRLPDWSRRKSRGLRSELYEVHHLIDALNRRFPALDTIDPGLDAAAPYRLTS